MVWLRIIFCGGKILFFLLCDYCDVIVVGMFEFIYEIIGWFSGFGWCFCKRIFLGLGSIWGGILVVELVGLVDLKLGVFMMDEGVGFLFG